MTLFTLDHWRRGREIAVVGLARSGAAATRLLRRLGFDVYASDSGAGAELEACAAELRVAGAVVELGRHDPARIARAAGVVVSPGVPPEAPPLVAARAAGVEILSEVEIGLAALGARSRYVAITGTNGKTTTTALTAHVLRAIGLDAEACGNIGRPVCDVALAATPPAWLVLEVSSFQLHDCPYIAPAVGVLTNLAPNHLDRYATLEEYYGDKARLFANASASSVWVTNGGDPAVQALVAGVPGTHQRFSVRQRAEAWFDRAGGQLRLNDDVVMPRAELQLLGDHNVENALAATLVAAAVARMAGQPAPPLGAIAEGLRSFRAIPHRVEPVRTVDGVRWINDSKSTNVTSTEVALRAVDGTVVLLLGGRHKGEPYTRLAPLLAGRCRGVVAFGEAASIVKADLGALVPVVEAGSDFAQVMREARRLAQPGDVVLLSPACSSYDMFEHFEHRGEVFRAMVNAL
ncbi:MAG: UDP-N-acetylmuramoyl-L-alanine--D-glutamate ligase [Gemmatimonadota bacterium]